jgi:flagellar hook protein FlgE
MGIQSAMYSGVSGLNANSQAMSVIGNNLANTNTLGFKSARTVFSDLLSSNIAGSGGNSQVGRGVGLSTVDNVLSQGTFETTASDTDVAIEGNGFFVLKEIGNTTDFYSRAGAFRFDGDGYLVNPEGLVVQGKLFDTVDNTTLQATDPTHIQVANVGLIPANATTELTFTTNLNEKSKLLDVGTKSVAGTSVSTGPIIAAGELIINGVPIAATTTATVAAQVDAINDQTLLTGVTASEVGGVITLTTDLNSAGITLGGTNVAAIGFTGTVQTLTPTITNPDINPADKKTYNYSASSQVFDSLGNSHLVSVYWRLVSDASNTWTMGYTVDNNNTLPIATLTTPLTFTTTGNLPDTNGDGKPDPVTESITIPPLNNGANAITLALTFDCTQFDSDSVVIGQKQNGYSAGSLTNVAINGEGVVVASYSNGKQINIAQLVLAKFQNPGGLQLAGSNRYTAPAKVGTIRVGIPGPELGRVFTNSLEQSNVDMGQEFVKMITTQRAFSANSKIITSVDEMLGELINLKR